MARLRTNESGSNTNLVCRVEELLGRRLQGLEAFQLQGHGTYNFRCSGFVIRKGGPMGVKLVSDEHKKGYEMVVCRRKMWFIHIVD